MFTLTLNAYFPHERMPDADTDVLVWEQGEAEAQLGAYVGDDDDGPPWVNAQGEGIEVVAWCALPQAAIVPQACGQLSTLLASGDVLDLGKDWSLPRMVRNVRVVPC